MIDDLTDEPEYDEGPDDGADYSEPLGSKTCVHCHQPTIGEQCGFCGNDLCPACFEMGAGFCHQRHTQEQIDAYEDEMYPPQDEAEKQQRERHRQARNELQALGILPKP